MDGLQASTVVHAEKPEVFNFLLDFESYPSYTEYVKGVDADGDGKEGTEYGIDFAWTVLEYRAESKVVEIDEPERIGWKITKDVNANGVWILEEHEDGTRVILDIDFDPDSADESTLPTPPLKSLDWVIEKVSPLAVREAESVMENVVEELEGEKRRPEITIHSEADSIDVQEVVNKAD